MLVLSVLALILWHTVHPMLILPDKNVPEGYKMVAAKDANMAVRASGLGVVSIFLLVFSGIAGFGWMLVDLVDRRKRFVWILPMLVCVFLQALHALPLALYLFIGRETPARDLDVN